MSDCRITNFACLCLLVSMACPSIAPAQEKACAETKPVTRLRPSRACPQDIPVCDQDVRLQIQLPSILSSSGGYTTANSARYSARGVNTFLTIFNLAAARGMENAAVRAFNSTETCDTCKDCPSDTSPPTAAPQPAGASVDASEATPPARQKKIRQRQRKRAEARAARDPVNEGVLTVAESDPAESAAPEVDVTAAIAPDSQAIAERATVDLADSLDEEATPETAPPIAGEVAPSQDLPTE